VINVELPRTAVIWPRPSVIRIVRSCCSCSSTVQTAPQGVAFPSSVVFESYYPSAALDVKINIDASPARDGSPIPVGGAAGGQAVATFQLTGDGS
jgi:hypothetical protein